MVYTRDRNNNENTDALSGHEIKNITSRRTAYKEEDDNNLEENQQAAKTQSNVGAPPPPPMPPITNTGAPPPPPPPPPLSNTNPFFQKTCGKKGKDTNNTTSKINSLKSGDTQPSLMAELQKKLKEKNIRVDDSSFSDSTTSTVLLNDKKINKNECINDNSSDFHTKTPLSNGVTSNDNNDNKNMNKKDSTGLVLLKYSAITVLLTTSSFAFGVSALLTYGVFSGVVSTISLSFALTILAVSGAISLLIVGGVAALTVNKIHSIILIKETLWGSSNLKNLLKGLFIIPLCR